MNKFLRTISTAVVGIGVLLLFVYLGFYRSIDKTQILNQPSYYTIQNYWWLLFAGCGCVAFSIVSCFLAWNKMMDEQVEILPNAVAVEKSELLSWLTGSSLDTSRKKIQKERSTTAKSSSNPAENLLVTGKTIFQKHLRNSSSISISEAEKAPATIGTETVTSRKTQHTTTITAEDTLLQTEASSIGDIPTQLTENVTIMDSATETANPDTFILAESEETLLDDSQTIIGQL